MAYVCELDTGHQVYLDNQGMQTIITTSSSLPGQQQQATSSMTTGAWVASPEAYRTVSGAVFKILTAQGEHFIYIQGGSVSMMREPPSLGADQRIQMQQTATMPPPLMQSMPPMKMSNMQMTINPMEMRMGNMEMRINSLSTEAGQSVDPKQFCSQCGTSVKPGDRFCSSCGNALS